MTSRVTPRRPCLDCGTPTTGTRCPRHDHARQRRAARVTAYGYGRAHWRRLRKQRLELDGHRCQLRATALCTGAATHVHLDPALEGRHDQATINDCVSCCASCSGAIDAPRAQGVGGPHRIEAEDTPRPARATPTLESSPVPFL